MRLFYTRAHYGSPFPASHSDADAVVALDLGHDVERGGTDVSGCGNSEGRWSRIPSRGWRVFQDVIRASFVDLTHLVAMYCRLQPKDRAGTRWWIPSAVYRVRRPALQCRFDNAPPQVHCGHRVVRRHVAFAGIGREVGRENRFVARVLEGREDVRTGYGRCAEKGLAQRRCQRVGTHERVQRREIVEVAAAVADLEIVHRVRRWERLVFNYVWENLLTPGRFGPLRVGWPPRAEPCRIMLSEDGLR